MAVCFMSLCLVLSCDKSRLKDLDNQIDQLEKEDAKILKELSDAIDELEKTLLAKIQEANDRLNGDIDAAVLEMMDYLNMRMEENQEYLETELARRKEECDEVASALRARGDDVAAELDKALDNTKIRIQQAIEANDEDMHQKLLLLQENIVSAYDCIDAAETALKKWEETIRRFEATGMYDTMDKMKGMMGKLSQYDVQTSVNEVEEYAKKFARVHLDKLTKKELEELRNLVSDMDSWMDSAEGYVANSESMKDEMSSLLEDWQDRADDLYGSVESLRDDVMAGYEDIISVYKDVIDSVEFLAEDVADKGSELIDVVNVSVNWYNQLASNSDALESETEEMLFLIDEVEEAAWKLSDDADDLYERCQRTEDWLNDHPWYYDS